MRHEVPAPGYTLTEGRKPRLPAGYVLLCQLRNGHVDPYGKPWPIGDVRWSHDGSAGDVVAVKWQVGDG